MSEDAQLNRLDRPTRDAAPRLSDYEQERATFSAEAPERYNPVLAIVESWAQEGPDAPAVVSVDAAGEVVDTQTAAQLAAASRRAARAFLDAGIKQGDRVFVMLPRIPEWYAALLGAMRIGAVPMPGPNLLTPHDIADRITRAGARAAVTDAPGAAKVEDAGVELIARFCVGADPAGSGAGGARWIDLNEACEQAGDGETPSDPTHRDDPLLLY